MITVFEYNVMYSFLDEMEPIRLDTVYHKDNTICLLQQHSPIPMESVLPTAIIY